jgi:hypothetical protein
MHRSEFFFVSRIFGPILGLVLLVLLLTPAVFADSASVGPDSPVPVRSAASSVEDWAYLPAVSISTPQTVFLPVVSRQTPPLSWRLGFGALGSPITRYPEVGTLRAGWYVDWNVRVNPARPNGMEYVQTVRIHQTLACGQRWHFDREACPYATPPSYEVYPDLNTVLAAVQANPGALWQIGNEMDRRDWCLDLAWNGSQYACVSGSASEGQDEMLPELYAVAFHELSTLIRQTDPTARIAIGGVIQATPLRLEYLDKVWNAYQSRYGQAMPVDVWNIHNFILKERLGDYGASVPPGASATVGVTYDTDLKHVDLDIFKQQVVTFRQWLKDKGQQQKPLYVSEYGVLYWHDGMDNPTLVQNFMLGTFDYFLNAADCNLGYGADGCRLVQRWAWYSLDDVALGSTFNPHAGLFYPSQRTITPTGEQFRAYSLANLSALSQP